MKERKNKVQENEDPGPRLRGFAGLMPALSIISD